MTFAGLKSAQPTPSPRRTSLPMQENTRSGATAPALSTGSVLRKATIKVPCGIHRARAGYRIKEAVGRLGHLIVKRTVLAKVAPRQAGTPKGIVRDLRRQLGMLLRNPAHNSIETRINDRQLTGIMTRLAWLRNEGVIDANAQPNAAGQSPTQVFLRSTVRTLVQRYGTQHLQTLLEGNLPTNLLAPDAPKAPPKFAKGIQNMQYEMLRNIISDCVMAELDNRSRIQDEPSTGSPTFDSMSAVSDIPIDDDLPEIDELAETLAAFPSVPTANPSAASPTHISIDIPVDDGWSDTASWSTASLTNDETSTVFSFDERDSDHSSAVSLSSPARSMRSKSVTSSAQVTLSQKTQLALNEFSRVLRDYFDLAPYVLTPSLSTHLGDHDLHMKQMDQCLAAMSSAYRTAHSGAGDDQRVLMASQIAEMVASYADEMTPSQFANFLAASNFSTPDFHRDGVTPLTLDAARHNAPMAWHSVITAEFAKAAERAPEKLEQALAALRDDVPEEASGSPGTDMTQRTARAMRPFSRVAQSWPYLDWGPIASSTVADLANALDADGDDAFKQLQSTVAQAMHLPYADWVEHAEGLVSAHAMRANEADTSKKPLDQVNLPNEVQPPLRTSTAVAGAGDSPV